MLISLQISAFGADSAFAPRPGPLHPAQAGPGVELVVGREVAIPVLEGADAGVDRLELPEPLDLRGSEAVPEEDVHQEEAQEDPVADGDHFLVAQGEQPLLGAADARADLVEGLAPSVRVVRIIAVGGHPDRPAPQPLVLERELLVALRLAQLLELVELLDREPETSAEDVRRLARPPEGAGQHPGRARPAQVAG